MLSTDLREKIKWKGFFKTYILIKYNKSLHLCEFTHSMELCMLCFVLQSCSLQEVMLFIVSETAKYGLCRS